MTALALYFASRETTRKRAFTVVDCTSTRPFSAILATG